MSGKKILLACEESQAVTIEFRKLGFDAFSCDLQDCSGGHPEWHIKDNIFNVIKNDWDMMLGFPPCTFLTVSGARWMYSGGQINIDRLINQNEAINSFLKLFNSNIKYIALENPVGVLSSRFRKPDQIIQPYYFGDQAQKTTCLWMKGLPKLKHFKTKDMFNEKITHTHKGEMVTTSTGKKFSKWYWETSFGGKDRAKLRSKTFPGIAKAMAEQWGGVL